MLNILLSSLVNGTKSMVLGVGKIVAIDLEARDLTIETKTPIRGKTVTSVLHMWKFNGEEYGSNDAWEGRGNWRADSDRIAVGKTIFFIGHLGNIKDDKYGRIICTGYGLPAELTPASNTPVEDADDDYDA